MNSGQQVSDCGYFCQVDTHRATKDYLGKGRCVRLFGIQQHEFSDAALADGVKTFTIDIDYWRFSTLVLSLKSWREVHAQECAEIDARDDDTEIMSRWYLIEMNFNAQDAGYVYETFSESAPRRFGIASFEMIGSGQSVPAIPSQSLGKPSMSLLGYTLVSRRPGARKSLTQRHISAPFFFDSFHVGQGMCSLVHDGYSGILLDAGAGKPVTRKAYLSKALKNDLVSAIATLKRLCLVVSHADSDHWRILSWDSALRQKVDHIFVPLGARSLALRDRAILKKIVGIASQTWQLNKASTLRLLRSDPKLSDSNGDCLVAVFERQHEKVLAAGDYVYARFSVDKNSAISALAKEAFSGVVVPHHGDAASGIAVVACKSGAKAFFSAGTHQGYGHPTALSLSAHQRASYSVVNNPTLPDIVRIRLL